MKFNMNNFTSIFTEGCCKENKKECVGKCRTEDKEDEINDIFNNDELHKLYDDLCPITGEVFDSMKKAAADPDNLKITMIKDENTNESYLFIEATEFANFCEANDMNPGEAGEKIIDHYKESIPEMDNAEIHVVFPDDSLSRNILGGENLGQNVKNDWSMELMSGCRRYGLKANCGVQESSIDPLNEAFGKDKSSRKYFGKNINAVISEINSASKTAFVTFKDKMSKSSSKSKQDDLEEFYTVNKSAPKFKSFDTSTEIPAALLNTRGSDDFVLFYQDEVRNQLNKSDKFTSLGYKAYTEDHPGIYIKSK